MSASPFAFYRGGAAIMASDLAGTPVAGISAQLCGDAHLLNFGMLFETPERFLVSGLNDFDETLRGPFDWDVKQLAVSVPGLERSAPAPTQGSTAVGTRALRGTARQLRVRRSASGGAPAADAVGERPMLGWYRLRALDDRMHDFYVRQLWYGKASIEVADLDLRGFTAYGESCGWTLARAHARSGVRIAIAAYLGEEDGFDRSIAEYASTYADVNDADYERFRTDIADGRLAAITGI